MKKILFPFYKKNRHEFLLRKWWFRAIIVLYILAFIITPFVLFLSYMDSASGWCYHSLFYTDQGHFNEKVAICMELDRQARMPAVGLAIIGTLIFHYLIQVIFFKIIINFIVLGNKK